MAVGRGKTPFVLGKRGEEILKSVYFYRYMTALDVCYLLYSPASLAHVRRVLTDLSGGGDHVDNEYLYRFPLQRGVGNRVRVYTLGARGRDYFKRELEYPVSWYFRPDKVRHLSVGQMMHNLLLTRFLVGAEKWSKEREGAKILKVRTCYEAGPDYPSSHVVEDGKEAEVKVIPDAWVLVEVAEGEKRVRFPVLLEIDRGTAYKNRFKAHITSRIEFIKRGGVYSRLFGGEAVMVAYVTTGDTQGYRESRLRAMCVWTEEVLKELRKEAWASVFRFCAVSFDEVYEAGLFDNKLWYRPDQARAVGLFES